VPLAVPSSQKQAFEPAGEQRVPLPVMPVLGLLLRLGAGGVLVEQASVPPMMQQIESKVCSARLQRVFTDNHARRAFGTSRSVAAVTLDQTRRSAQVFCMSPYEALEQTPTRRLAARLAPECHELVHLGQQPTHKVVF
jgi:hypothetical protein